MTAPLTRRSLLQAFGLGALSLSSRQLSAQTQNGATDQPDLTFFGWSDTHVPVNGDASRHTAAIEAMNTLPGTSFPRSIGGEVETPAFIFNAGDLTEWPTWQALKTYEDIITKRLDVPSYEILGNHDSADGVPGFPQIMKEWFIRRYGSLSYTFKQGGVHFICPFSTYDERLHNPRHAISEDALIFIREYLARHNAADDVPANLDAIPRREPVVVAMHLCYDSITNPDALVDVLAEGNVAMVLGGHYHKPRVTTYRDINFVQLPSVKSDEPAVTVIRITPDRLTAIPYDYVNRRWIEDADKMLDTAIG